MEINVATTMKDVSSPPGGWRQLDAPRVALVSRKKAGLISRIALFFVERFGKLEVANLWLMMKINPRLSFGALFFVSRLMPFGELRRIDTELLILRVAWNCRARYEWGQHVEIAQRVGLSAEDIRRIADGPNAPGLSSRQVTLLNACDEFHRDRLISDSTWQHLACHFNDRLVVELLFVIGFYEGLAGVLNSVGLPLDKAMDEKLALLQNPIRGE